MEHYSSFSAVGELRFYISILPGTDAERRGDNELSALPVRGNAAVAAFQRHGPAIGKFHCGTVQPDYENYVPCGDPAAVNFSFVSGEPFAGDCAGCGGIGPDFAARERGSRAVAGVVADSSPFCRGGWVDCGCSTGLFAGHRAGDRGCDDV